MMNIFKFKYRYCKSRMVAFIHDELSLVERRRVARFIDECPDCYREYVRQRALQRELVDDLPTFGYPDSEQLDRMWTSIQDELWRPKQRTRPTYPSPTRYALVALALVLVLMLPLVFGERPLAPVTVTQPAPVEMGPTPTEGAPSSDVRSAGTMTRSVDLTGGANVIIMPEAVPNRTPSSRK